MYCLLIPTYKPHFNFVKKLIRSIDKFCSDTIKIYIVVSSSDYESARAFQTLSSKVDVSLLCFKEIMKSLLNIDIDEEKYLADRDKFTFQSIKKITSVYYLVKLNYKYIYVVDSEGLYIRPFSFEKIIGDYTKNKRIFYNSRQRIDMEQSNISKQLLHQDIPGWFLENYFWIYEDIIVKDFWDYLFSNIKTYEELLTIPRSLFIEVVYYHYIYIHKYDYTFIDSYETMAPYLGDKIHNYTRDWWSLLEDIRFGLNPDSIQMISNYFNDYSIQNFKMLVNDYNIEFLKKTNILFINSGDFPEQFNLDIV
jgi:hypothetical protein